MFRMPWNDNLFRHALPSMENDFHQKEHLAAIYLFHAQCSTLLRIHGAAPEHEMHFRSDTGQESQVFLLLSSGELCIVFSCCQDLSLGFFRILVCFSLVEINEAGLRAVVCGILCFLTG
jgi:hypothetical protein